MILMDFRFGAGFVPLRFRQKVSRDAQIDKLLDADGGAIFPGEQAADRSRGYPQGIGKMGLFDAALGKPSVQLVLTARRFWFNCKLIIHIFNIYLLGALMTFAQIFTQILSEVTNRPQEEVNELLDTFRQVHPEGNWDREYSPDEAQNLIEKLRKEAPGIRAWLSEGAESALKRQGSS